jgi:hypothetical protein
MSGEDYYSRLKLHPSADHAMVGEAYWHLARKYRLEMDDDVSAKRRLEELNEAFAVLGNPVDRAAYDNMLSAEATQERKKEKVRRRVSIEVSYWRLPAWQGVMAATGGVALAVLALLAGASLAATLALTIVAVTAALLPMKDEWKPLTHKQEGWSAEGERELKALELERSTAAIIARWREASGNQGNALTPSFMGLDDGAVDSPRGGGA